VSNRFELKELLTVEGSVIDIQFSPTSYFIFTNNIVYTNLLREYPKMTYSLLSFHTEELNFTKGSLIFPYGNFINGSKPIFLYIDELLANLSAIELAGQASFDLNCKKNSDDDDGKSLKEFFEVSFFSLNCPKFENISKNSTQCFIHQNIFPFFGNLSDEISSSLKMSNTSKFENSYNS
jgi:hypothetical protein